jgi:hypothetical protein
VCSDCGFVGDKPHADPMRSESKSMRATCPGCGAESWLDPGNAAHRDFLWETDERHRPRRFAASKRALARVNAIGRMLLAIGLVAGCFLPLWGMTVDGSTHWIHLVGFMVLPAGIAGLVLIGAVRNWIAHRPLRRPARWRWATEPGALSSEITDTVTTDDELLRAPLSGRPCVAYEVAARADHVRDGQSGTWLLADQHACDLQVGDVHIPGSQLRLRPRHRTPVDATSDRARAYLQERGLAPGEVGRMFETIVEPAEAVRARPRRGAPVQLHVEGDEGTPDPARSVSSRTVGRALFTTYLVGTVLALMIPLWIGMTSNFIHVGYGIKHMAGILMTFGFGLPLVAGVLGLIARYYDERVSPHAGNVARLMLALLALPAWVLAAHWWDRALAIWSFVA